MNKDLYKKAMNNLKIPADLEQKTINFLRNNQANNKTSTGKIRTKSMPIKRFIVITAIISACLLLSVSAVFAADKIKEFVTARLSFENRESINIADIAHIEIPDNLPVGDTPMKVNEAETVLGVNILTSSMANNDNLYYTTSLADKNIAIVDLWYPGFIEYQNGVPEESSEFKSISESMRFMTQYVTENYRLAFEEGIDATSGKRIEKNYHINKLDTDAVLYTNDWSDTRLTATFVYENIFYIFIGNNISELEMTDILESLE